MLRRTRIRPVSKKRSVLNREYSRLRREYLAKHPTCEVCQTSPSTDIHHKVGRGKYLLHVGTWVALCRACHTGPFGVHNNQAWARANGLILSRREIEG